MAKAVIKTTETEASVDEFLNALADEKQRADALTILAIFSRVTGEHPKMWGPAIIGFGNHNLKYDSGRELEWMITGFSPRKANLTLYINDSSGGSDDLLAKLGKFKTGKGCLYIRRLADVDLKVLEQMVERAFERACRAGSGGQSRGAI